MEDRKSKILVFVFLALLLTQLGLAQVGGGSEVNPWGSIDNLFTHAEINSSTAFLRHVLLPIVGMAGLLYWLIIQVLNLWESRVPVDANPPSERVAKLLSIVGALLAIFYWPWGVIGGPILIALILGALYLLYRLVRWLLDEFGGIGGGGGGGNPPDVQVGFNNSNPDPGDSTDSVEFQIQVSDNSGSGLDELEIMFEGTNNLGAVSLSGSSDTVTKTITDVIGTSTNLTGGGKNYRVEATDNDGNTGDDAGILNVTGGGPTNNPPTIQTLNASDINSGDSLNDVEVRFHVRDNSGSGLNELLVRAPAFDQGAINLNGADSEADSEALASIIGSNTNPADGTYDVNVELVDNNGDTTTGSTQFKVGDSSTGGGGVNQNQDVTVTQQQMQEVILALIEGNLGQGDGGNYVFYGPQQQQQQMLGGISPGVYSTFLRHINMMNVNQQMLVRQLIQFMSENNYQEINNQVIINFMQQVLDIDIDGGDIREGDIIVQINQLIQQINITQLEQNIQNIITEVNITNTTYIEQLMNILIAIEDGDIELDGDIIVINAHQEIRIKSATLLTFLNILQVIKFKELKTMIIALVETSGDTSWEVRIEKIIMVYREGGDGENNRDRWNIFLSVVEESDLSPNIKKTFEKIARLKEGTLESDISEESLVLFRRVIMQIPIDRVEYSTKNLVDYISNKKYDRLNDEALVNATEYLRTHQPASKNYKSNKGHYYSMADDTGNLGSLEQTVKQLIDEMKGELKLDEQIVNEDKEIIEDLGDALQDIEEWAPIISDLMEVQLPGNNDHVSAEDFFHEMQAVVQAHQELQSKEASKQLMNDMEEVKNDLEEAIADLKDKEGKQKKEIEQEVSVGKHLDKVEDAYLGNLEAALEKLKKYKSA